MNKQTRIFVWGVVLVLSCTVGLSLHLIEMVNGVWEISVWKLTLLIGTTLGVLAGGISIYKSLN